MDAILLSVPESLVIILELENRAKWPGAVLVRTITSDFKLPRYQYRWTRSTLASALHEAQQGPPQRQHGIYPSVASRVLNRFVEQAQRAIDVYDRRII